MTSPANPDGSPATLPSSPSAPTEPSDAFFGQARPCLLITTAARGDPEQCPLEHEMVTAGFMRGAPGCRTAPCIGRKRPEEVGPLLGDQLLLLGGHRKQPLDYRFLGRTSSCGDYSHQRFDQL